MKKIIFILVALLGLVACKKQEEVKPETVIEYVQEPISEQDEIFQELLYTAYKIPTPKLNGAPLSGYYTMFDHEIDGGEFILVKGQRPYHVYMMLDTARYEVLSISDTSINLNDGLYIKR